jgi:hypothetical protein
MANNKRPPLELEEKQPVIQEEQDKEYKQQEARYPIPNGVSPTHYPSETPQKREIKRRQPFDVYHDQVDLLKKLSLRDQMNGELGTMSRMVREALDEYLKDKKL